MAFSNNERLKHWYCNQCDESFKCKSTLKTHMRYHTGERLYKCNLCDELFIYKVHLTVHMAYHIGMKLHMCSQCDRSFTSKSHLVVHMRIHTGERPYKCNQCDKSFMQKNTLNSHLKNYCRKTLYRCKQCHESFKLRSDLKVHIRKHIEERSYNCTHCDMYFKRKYFLTIHLKNVHTDGKLYKKRELDKTFIHKDVVESRTMVYSAKDVKRHNKQIHSSTSDSLGYIANVNHFACFICKLRFNNLNECRQHIKSHKKIITPKLIKDYARTPTKENKLNINGGQNYITVPKDKITINVVQEIPRDFKQELEDRVQLEYEMSNPVHTSINPSRNDSQKSTISIDRKQVSTEMEHNLFNHILKQEPLEYIDVKLEEDGILDGLSLVK